MVTTMKIMTMTAMMILTIASGRRMLMTMAVVRSRIAAVMTTCARSCMCMHFTMLGMKILITFCTFYIPVFTFDVYMGNCALHVFL